LAAEPRIDNNPFLFWFFRLLLVDSFVPVKGIRQHLIIPLSSILLNKKKQAENNLPALPMGIKPV